MLLFKRWRRLERWRFRLNYVRNPGGGAKEAIDQDWRYKSGSHWHMDSI